MYTGEQYDQETQQYYVRARYYNPVIGRFTQEDTYRGDGLNLYAYCHNNPVMYYDPSGHAYNSPNKEENAKNQNVTGKEGGSGSKGIDDILGGAKETTNNAGVARNFEKPGGFGKTLEDFNALNPTNVKDIQTQYGLGKVGKLSDGTTIIARPGSKTGGATLEIKVSNSKVYKVRY